MNNELMINMPSDFQKYVCGNRWGLQSCKHFFP